MLVSSLFSLVRRLGRGLPSRQVATLLFAIAATLLLQAGLAQEDAPVQAPEGSDIYYSHGCSICHGEDGEGSTGPALRGDPKLASDEYVADQILFGGGGMPPYRHQLSSEQISQVATFIRSSWGNDLGAISTEYVEERAALNEDADVTSPTGAQVHAWNCMICHGVNGEGGVGPPFAGNPALADTAYVIAQIQLGGGGMPPFEPILSDESIARVTSFIRQAWGNKLPPVDEETVRAMWQGLRPESGSAGAAPDEVTAGEELFGALGCAGCHSAEGAGGMGPPLDGNLALARPDYVLTTIRDGRKGMPAFGEMLSDEQLELIVNYVMNAWSNDFGQIRLAAYTELPAGLRRDQADPLAFDDSVAAGEELFGVMGCAGCHSAEGAGGMGPALDGNLEVAKADYVVNTILTGGRAMPPYGEILSDAQVAALASYVRNAWSNDYDVVEANEVSRLRPRFRTEQP